MLYAREDQAVKEESTAAVQQALESLLRRADDGATVRKLEEHVWDTVVEIGRSLMTAGLSRLCARATERDVDERGLDSKPRTRWATRQRAA